MNHNDNADPLKGRRDEDSIPAGCLDCTEASILGGGLRDGDERAVERIADQLVTMHPQHHRTFLEWLLESSTRGGDA